MVNNLMDGEPTTRLNKIIKHNLKMKLEEHKGLWTDELPKVL